MEPSGFYEKKIEELEKELKKLLQKKSAFGWLRLGTVGFIFCILYFLWHAGIVYVILGIVGLLTLFIRLLYADLRNQGAINHTQRLIGINQDEIEFLHGNFHNFPDGSEHVPEEHLYANDLDLVGKDSLFQYLNRTTSEMGSLQLYNCLLRPASLNVIRERQTSIKELSQKITWIQGLQAKGKEKKVTFLTQKRLQSWMDEPAVFLNFRPWRWLRYLLPIIILTIVTLYIFDAVPSSVFYGGLLAFSIIAYQVNKHIAPIHEQLSRMAEEMDILSESLEHIEKATFESPHLCNLQKSVLQDQKGVSDEIHQLHHLLDKLDVRYNIILSLPLNLLLLWNLQQVLDLEKWKTKEQKNIHSWFETLGNIEALSSFGVLHFNQPQWVFPNVVHEYFEIEGKSVGHPLIRESKRVNNDIRIDKAGVLMLVTGSNMAGKSTYLRSVGVNVILAMTGAPVCASFFKISHVTLITSMRVNDNLAESTSTFYAELKKLKTIIDAVNKGENVFVLLDEILRGTNSKDRHTGSVALAKQLIKHKSNAIIATHDLELPKLQEEFPDKILNFHFDVQVAGEELYFDYLLKPGICNSLNASILMKKIGIEL